MKADEGDELRARCMQLEALLSAERSKVVYFQKIAETTGQKYLQEVGRLLELIARLKKTDEALQHSEQRFRDIAMISADFVWEIDENWRYTFCSGRVADVLGYSPEELIGKTPFDLMDSEEATRVQKEIAERLSELDPLIDFENVNRHKDGRPVVLLTNCGPIVNHAGRRVGYRGIDKNITDKKRAQLERQELDGRLATSQKLESLGVLAGGIAHDFNNLLAAILTRIGLAKACLDNTEAIEDLVEAETACRRAVGLTKQLLTFAKGGTPVKEVTSLVALIQEGTEFCLHGSNCTASFSMLDPSPVEVDSGQINQVVQNLVINAIQAMPHGGTIHVSAENVIQRGTRFVRWTVGDQGVGIPADQLSRVFDPFFTTKRAGTGLGLAVSHSIIAKHGGWMAVESAVGAGTTFSVYLPAADVDPPEQELPSLIPPHAPVRVLVMDDEPMVHRALSRALGRGAHQAVCVETGEEAVLKYRQAVATGHRFDVVILDLTVRGGMGGRDTAREILHEDPEAKIVVASGYCDDPVMASYREFGFVASMAKPFSSEDVIRLIARISRR